MEVTQGFFNRSRIACLDGILEHQIGLFPPDSQTVILDGVPSSFGDPCHWVFVKSAAAFGLAVFVAITVDNVGDALMALLPGIADIPIDGVHDDAVYACVQPEAGDFLRLLLPLHTVPVILWKFDGLAFRIFSRPASPVVVLRALAVGPVLDFIRLVVQ